MSNTNPSQENQNPTQCKIILKFLQSGRSITSLGAIRKWNILRLASRIYEIRKAGHKIENIGESNGKKHYARYILRKK